MTTKKNGFSLVELLVFITIVGLFFVSAVTISVATLRNLKASEHRLIATRYSEELGEWLTEQKEFSWEAFVARATTSGLTYCFPSSPISDFWPAPASNCPLGQLNPTIYTRKVTLISFNSDNQVKADIIISWNEAGGTPQSLQLIQTYAVWE